MIACYCKGVVVVSQLTHTTYSLSQIGTCIIVTKHSLIAQILQLQYLIQGLPSIHMRRILKIINTL
jgi:hypothetical protein